MYINKFLIYQKLEQCLVKLLVNQTKRIMKRLKLILPLVTLLVFAACSNEGPPGPMGPRGYDGLQGPQGEQGESGYVFEWEEVDFAEFNEAETELQAILPYPDNFEGLTSDVALVYFLWGDYETNDGEIVEIWRQLPQLIRTPSGTINYNFDFSKYDVRLFLQPDYSFDLLEPIDTDGWVVRVVIVPGDFWDSGRVDFSDYKAVKEALGLPDLDKKSDTRTRRSIQ